MALILIGINHTTATVALREKVAFPPEVVQRALAELCQIDSVNEAVIVSTCNRTELYLGCESDQLQSEKVIDWLARFHGLERQELDTSSYAFEDAEVVRHLMKVSCGLDSMVLGEPQILGQIKSAFAVSKEFDAVGPALGRVFQDSFSIAKQVRTQTAIGQNPVSVAYAAVTLSERIFSNLASLNVLLIGAGKTIELVVTHLYDRGVRNIVVANRTLDNALDMAGTFGGHGVLLSDIPERLVEADIVVSSTNSQLPLLGKGTVESALRKRKHKPMLLVDLAVPRDIEAEVGEIPDAYLYSIDDIAEVIEDGVKSREEAAAEAKKIIEEGVREHLKQQRALNAVATLRAFRENADSIRESELQRALKSLVKGEAPEAVVSALARGLTNKLIHAPSVQMKKASAEGRDEFLLLIRELYELESESD
jgi:glutamyl-tRNA reductase